MSTDWWTPRRADWWVAVLFVIGSSCFGLGALPFYAEAVGANTDNLTYFVGSLFFTSVALLQFLISTGVVHADERPGTVDAGPHIVGGKHDGNTLTARVVEIDLDRRMPHSLPS